jgi:hypothetical protein
MRTCNLWTSGNEARISILPVLREVILPLFVRWRDELCSAQTIQLVYADRDTR